MSAKQIESRIAQLEQLVATLQTENKALSISIGDSGDKKGKSNVNKDGTPKKPRAKTGYLVFSCEKREEVKTSLEKEKGEPPKSKDVVSKLGEVWKGLSDDEKKVWNDKAKKMAEEASE